MPASPAWPWCGASCWPHRRLLTPTPSFVLDTFASLNLHSVEPDAFDDDDIAVASVFAAHAAVALAGATREAQLEAKADTRDVIGMAKGRQGVSDEEAFSILRRASQRTNVKLREMAERIVRTPAPPEELRESGGT